MMIIITMVLSGTKSTRSGSWGAQLFTNLMPVGKIFNFFRPQFP